MDGKFRKQPPTETSKRLSEKCGTQLRKGGHNKEPGHHWDYGAASDGFVKERRAVTGGEVARLAMQ
jgi:hypothetical protein